jgi:3-mercaptopyruvate sulfurtransferase SseA
MTMGFAKVFAIKGGFAEWVEAGFPLEKKTSLKEACIDCHANLSPSIVSEWQQSKHRQNQVLCLVCHGDQHESEQDVAKAVIPGIGVCKRCHETEDDPVVNAWIAEFRKTHNPKAR